MAFHPKKYFSNYFRNKKPLGIIFDAIFVILILLLLIPATRKETMAFFIRWTSLPASTLSEDDQFQTSNLSKTWQIYTLAGEPVSFGELNGKPVFLNIWATWCPPCIAELPSIEDLYSQFGDQVSFVLVSNEDPKVVATFAEKHGYSSLPFYIARNTPPDFYSQSIPTTFILDLEGKVVLKKKGAARWNADRTKQLLEDLAKR